MEDITRKRVMRKLEELPEEQLYQVLDYIEFIEAKYARQAARKPDPFQQFAERVEDQMRVRSLAPRAMRGTMKIMSTAGRVLDGVRELGRDLVEGPRPSASRSVAPRDDRRTGTTTPPPAGSDEGADTSRPASDSDDAPPAAGNGRSPEADSG